MRLFEYEAKALLAASGIAVPSGVVLRTPAPPPNLPLPAAVKAQVLAGRRGRAGGIRRATTPLQLEAEVEALLGSTLRGLPVEAVLVEEWLDVERELYVGLFLDRDTQLPTLLAMPRGGVDVEDAEDAGVLRLPVHVFCGLRPYHVEAVRRALELPRSCAAELSRVLGALWEVFLAYDATLLEVNPLTLTGDGALIAADARLATDDRAAEDHPEFAGAGDRSGLTRYERGAANRQAVGVEMDGNLAIVTSGAGVMMATADSIRARGGRPGPLLDLGGFQRSVGEQAEVMRLVLAFTPDTVLVNLFTQVLRCDELAEAMLLAFRDTGTPIVARLTGHMADRGAAILTAAGVPVSATYGTACDLAVASARARASMG